MRPLSKKPKKQRKYQFTVPKNDAHKLMSAALSPELRAAKGAVSLLCSDNLPPFTVNKDFFKQRRDR